jgi:signal transduction histidine kinase
VAIALVLAVGIGSAGDLREPVVAAAGSAVLLLFTTTWISGEIASRYVAAASMLVLVGVALAGGISRWALPGITVVAVAAVVAFPAHAIKFSGPSWDAGVAAWSAACAAGAPRADIPVGPGAWGVATISCPG